MRCIIAILALTLTAAALADTARGVVYHDRNANQRRDAGEEGLANVRISNGRDVVRTSAAGAYEIAIGNDDVIFVIKPSGWATPTDARNLPVFHYVHKPAGSPESLEFPGVAPTGPLPASIDFPLSPADEPPSFEIILLGDPQPRDSREIGYFARTIIPDAIEESRNARFALALGDIMYDDLSLFDEHNNAMATLGMPIRNVHGNHDLNFDVASDKLSDETWERVYGPSSYSFDVGGVHFLVIDDVIYEGHIKHKQYRGGLSDETLRFIESDLAHVDPETLVVVAMHIPIDDWDDESRVRFFRLLAPFERTLSLSAHWHMQIHRHYDSSDGWPRDDAHHHLIHATACGAWWTGAPDEYGIPHAMQWDGAPRGFSIVRFDGADYSIRFRAAGRPAAAQMHLWAPDSLKQGELDDAQLIANVWAGSERSTTEMRIGGGAWRPMRRELRPDPYFAELKRLEATDHPPPGRNLPEIKDVHHLWVANLPADLAPGAHLVTVRSTDMFGQVSTARTVLTVHEGP